MKINWQGWILLALGLFLIIYGCTGCSYATYEARPDGSTDASGFEIGTTKALSGLEFRTAADGSRSVTIESLTADQVEGLKQINNGLSLLIEGTVKGAK